MAGPSIELALVPGPHKHQHTIASTVHGVLSTFAFFLWIPLHLLYHHVFFRWRSPLVQVLDRRALNTVGREAVLHFFLKAYPAFGRPVFALALPNKWWKEVEVVGTKGRWIAPPGTEGKRGEDEVVLLWVHGGGFTHDTGGACLPFHIQLAKVVNKRGVKFSIFALDYQLAPEKIYPSQLIETLAAYHYLVNEVGIPPSKICIGGDSAGGNLTAAFLLHLARPNPKVMVPAELGATPGRPGSALLVSPYVDLVSFSPSYYPPFEADYLDQAGLFPCALQYVGVLERDYPPELSGWRHSPSWNPLRWFGGKAGDPVPKELALDTSLTAEEAEKDGKGLEMLSSPYVNPTPALVKDMEWYKEAFPGEGRTLVMWGSKEIFADDIAAFFTALKTAGVAPVDIVKPFAVHDWVLFDSFLPFHSRDKNGGEQAQPLYGLNKVADFLVAQADEVDDK
ncbi:hypothetical protein JCM8547_003162 [Rhodosporidiobolus lusitaniae]